MAWPETSVNIRRFSTETALAGINTRNVLKLAEACQGLFARVPYRVDIPVVRVARVSDPESKDIVIQAPEGGTAIWTEYRMCADLCGRLAGRVVSAIYATGRVHMVNPNYPPTVAANVWDREVFSIMWAAELLSKDAMQLGEQPFYVRAPKENGRKIVAPKLLERGLDVDVKVVDIDRFAHMMGIEVPVIRLVCDSPLVPVSFTELGDGFFVDSDGVLNLLLDLEDAVGQSGSNHDEDVNFHLRHQIIKTLVAYHYWSKGAWNEQYAWRRAKQEAMKVALRMNDEYFDIVRIARG